MERIGRRSGSMPADVATAGTANGRVAGRRALMLAALPCLVLAACTGSGKAPRTDQEKVVFETLKLLTGPGQAICVDAATAGRPLDIFRTMTSNPPPGLRLPVWYAPAGLKPTSKLTMKQLYRTTQTPNAVHIDQPGNTTPELSPALQEQLDHNAWAMSNLRAEQKVKISPDWPVPGLRARWWVRNRVSFHCRPNYRIANPIVVRNVAYVTVTAEHWGTIYALARQGSNWVVRAQWSNWLY